AHPRPQSRGRRDQQAAHAPLWPPKNRTLPRLSPPRADSLLPRWPRATSGAFLCSSLHLVSAQRLVIVEVAAPPPRRAGATPRPTDLFVFVQICTDRICDDDDD